VFFNLFSEAEPFAAVLIAHGVTEPMFLLKTFKALNGLLCADVPLRNYSLTHSQNPWLFLGDSWGLEDQNSRPKAESG